MFSTQACLIKNLAILFTCYYYYYYYHILIVDDKGIKDSWKEYMEKLMNEENEWDHKLTAEVKEGSADCIRMDEVRAALKEMKRHKAQGLSELVTKMIQATGEIGTQWILDLCNGIMKEGSIP